LKLISLVLFYLLYMVIHLLIIWLFGNFIFFSNRPTHPGFPIELYLSIAIFSNFVPIGITSFYPFFFGAIYFFYFKSNKVIIGLKKIIITVLLFISCIALYDHIFVAIIHPPYTKSDFSGWFLNYVPSVISFLLSYYVFARIF
jgi:hypothetical protein